MTTKAPNHISGGKQWGVKRENSAFVGNPHCRLAKMWGVVRKKCQDIMKIGGIAITFLPTQLSSTVCE